MEILIGISLLILVLVIFLIYIVTTAKGDLQGILYFVKRAERKWDIPSDTNYTTYSDPSRKHQPEPDKKDSSDELSDKPYTGTEEEKKEEDEHRTYTPIRKKAATNEVLVPGNLTSIGKAQQLPINAVVLKTQNGEQAYVLIKGLKEYREDNVSLRYSYTARILHLNEYNFVENVRGEAYRKLEGLDLIYPTKDEPGEDLFSGSE